MPRCLAVVAVSTLAPALLGAQASLEPTAFVASERVTVGIRADDPLCDGTEIRRLEIQRDAGKVLMLTGAAVGFLGAIAVHAHPGRGFPVVLASGALGLGGAIVIGTAHPSESFWQVTLPRAQRGVTTTEDVRSCLHEPATTSVAGAEEQWIYRAGSSGVFRLGRSASTVRFTFENGVLKELRRTAGEADADQPVSLGRVVP